MLLHEQDRGCDELDDIFDHDGELDDLLIRLASITDAPRIGCVIDCKSKAFEKTRLFLIRTMWTLALKFNLSKSTIVCAVNCFHLVLDHFINVADIDFANDFETTSSIRDVIWLSALTCIRFSVKFEEKPEVVWAVIGNEKTLIDSLPLLSGRYTTKEIVHFEDRVSRIIQKHMKSISSFTYLDIQLKLLSSMGFDSSDIIDFSGYCLALLTFSNQSFESWQAANAALVFSAFQLYGEKMANEIYCVLDSLSPYDSTDAIDMLRSLLEHPPMESSILTKAKTLRSGITRTLFPLPIE